MNILIAVAAKGSYQWYLQSSLVLLIIGGFVAATVIGSIAWYSSKRPAGWESAETPTWVTKMNIKGDRKDSPQS